MPMKMTRRRVRHDRFPSPQRTRDRHPAQGSSVPEAGFVNEHFEPLAREAAQAHWGHVNYLASLIHGEAQEREQRRIARRIRLARFPVIKTLDGFQWS